MITLKVIEEYDGRLPVYNVVRGVEAGDNCDSVEDQILKSFDSYEEAEKYCNSLIASSKVASIYNDTPCGEEDPCK